ncbi:hypothetical protein AGDE_12784 [Angomonas deanei]|nr:hypothetical protein AGDE_12784 [Angomonas deanei]|eukprot:EPY23507.1 hypothetical protein AGDE_12784 [Angomonas deanei]
MLQSLIPFLVFFFSHSTTITIHLERIVKFRMTSLTDSSGSLSSSLHISEHCEEETIKEAEAILRATGRRDINFITRIAPVALHGETVDVSTMYIGNDGLQILASFISRNLRIKILNMSNNKVNNDTVILLCRLFKQEIRDYIKLISAGRKTGSYDITLGSHMRYNLDLLNLSNNPDLSLAGGMALHSLLKEKLVRVKELKLENTNIPSSLKTKILKLLRSKDEFTPLVHQPSTKSELTMDSQLNLSFQTSFAIGKSSPPAQAARSRHEKNTIRDLRHRLEEIRNSQGTYRAMRVPFADNDWSVMQVAVVAAGSLFASEVQLLVEDIFRSLNKMLDTFRISLQPLIVDYCKSGSTFENLVDDIHSSPFLSIFFIGDRPGDEKRGNISSLYRLYKEATESCAFVLVAKRRRSTALDLPPALIPLFTLDEYYHQLDPYAETMSTTVDGLPADKAAYFHSFHEKFLESLFKYFPIPGLLANDYPATFDYVDEKGIVHLKGLSVFREMVYQRLMVLFSSVVSFDDKERMKAARRHKEGALFNQIELRKESVELHELLQRAFREQMAAKTSFSPFYLPFSGGTFEQIIRKLYKYLIDRLKTSVLVLEGKELNFMTSQLMSLLCARNLEKLLENNFRIVSYTSRYTALSEEPGDLRDMLIHLIGQITSNETILAYAHREIDVFRLQSVFQQ